MKANGKKYTPFDYLNPNDRFVAVEMDTGKVHILQAILATVLYEGKRDLVHVEFAYDKELRDKLRLFANTFTADSGSCDCISPDDSLMFISDIDKAMIDIKQIAKELRRGAKMLKEMNELLYGK